MPSRDAVSRSIVTQRLQPASCWSVSTSVSPGSCAQLVDSRGAHFVQLLEVVALERVLVLRVATARPPIRRSCTGFRKRRGARDAARACGRSRAMTPRPTRLRSRQRLQRTYMNRVAAPRAPPVNATTFSTAGSRCR